MSRQEAMVPFIYLLFPKTHTACDSSPWCEIKGAVPGGMLNAIRGPVTKDMELKEILPRPADCFSAIHQATNPLTPPGVAILVRAAHEIIPSRADRV